MAAFGGPLPSGPAARPALFLVSSPLCGFAWSMVPP
jgi:hypothetical protein